jgi:hypothetical protein
MENFFTLVCYEWKKLFSKKLVWVMLLVCLIMGGWLMADGVLGTCVYFHYDTTLIGSNNQSMDVDILREAEVTAMERDYLRSMEGRTWDESLLQELKEAYLRGDESAEFAYNFGEVSFLGWLRDYWLNGFAGELEDATLDHFQLVRHNYIANYCKEQQLSQEEMVYWQAQEDNLPPITVSYYGGWASLTRYSHFLCALVLLLVAFALCPLYSEEHSLRTDALLLSSRNGRGTLFLARFVAGESAAAVGTALLAVFWTLECVILYGPDGFTTPVQISSMETAYHLTMGEYALICMGVLVCAALVTGALTLLLSELCRTPIPAMVVPLLTVVISMIRPMDTLMLGRVPEQIESYLPFVHVYSLLRDYRLVTLGPVQLNSIQVGFLLYGGLTAVFGWLCWRSYQRYQVTGR